MQTINSGELADLCRDWKNNDLMMVNVLDPEAFREKHIPGSINLPVKQGDLAGQLEKLAGGKDRMIVVYCASTDCNASEKAAEQLEEAGFGQVIDFEGGMAEWEENIGNVKAAA